MFFKYYFYLLAARMDERPNGRQEPINGGNVQEVDSSKRGVKGSALGEQRKQRAFEERKRLSSIWTQIEFHDQVSPIKEVVKRKNTSPPE
jgi:hypothetical protein